MYTWGDNSKSQLGLDVQNLIKAGVECKENNTDSQ